MKLEVKWLQVHDVVLKLVFGNEEWGIHEKEDLEGVMKLIVGYPILQYPLE